MQSSKLEWERQTLKPAFQRLHEKNHVADAIVTIIEESKGKKA